jgi:hypothetical protein
MGRWWRSKRPATKVAIGLWGATAVLLTTWIASALSLHGPVNSLSVHSSVQRTLDIPDTQTGDSCDGLDDGLWDCQIISGSFSDIGFDHYLVRIVDGSSCWAAAGYPATDPQLSSGGSDPPEATGCIKLADGSGLLGGPTGSWSILALVALFGLLPLLLTSSLIWATVDQALANRAKRRFVSSTPEKPEA